MSRRTSPGDLLEDSRVWDQLLGLESLNSEAAANLQERAEAALQRLPPGIAPERLGAILDLYLRDARHVLWRSVEKLSDPHVEVLLAKLAELGPPYKHTPLRELQHRMLLAASARGMPVCRAAAEFLRRDSKFRHVPEALSRLRAWKSVPPELVDVLDAIIEEQLVPPSLTELLVFWSSVFLVARRSKTSRGLVALAGRLEEWKTARMGDHVEATFARVIAAAEPKGA